MTRHVFFLSTEKAEWEEERDAGDGYKRYRLKRLTMMLSMSQASGRFMVFE